MQLKMLKSSIIENLLQFVTATHARRGRSLMRSRVANLKKTIIIELEFEDKKLTDPTEIAEGFNKFFAEISPKLSENIEDIDTCFDKFVNQSISGN